MGVQDQVKTRPGNLLTPRGVNTPSGYTHEKGVFWGGGGVFHHLNIHGSAHFKFNSKGETQIENHISIYYLIFVPCAMNRHSM